MLVSDAGKTSLYARQEEEKLATGGPIKHVFYNIYIYSILSLL